MVQQISLILLGIALFCSPLAAESTRVSVHMTGIGSLSCAHWRSTQATRSEGWIFGFWTGLNYVAAATEQAQSNVADTAMVAQVEKICAKVPSEILASAAWTAYLDLNKR